MNKPYNKLNVKLVCGLLSFIIFMLLNTNLKGQETIVRFNAKPDFSKPLSKKLPLNFVRKDKNKSVFFGGNIFEFRGGGAKDRVSEAFWNQNTFKVYRTDQTLSKREINNKFKTWNDTIKKNRDNDIKASEENLKGFISSSLTDLEIGDDKIQVLTNDIMDKVKDYVSSELNNLTDSIKGELKAELLTDEDFLERMKIKLKGKD